MHVRALLPCLLTAALFAGEAAAPAPQPAPAPATATASTPARPSAFFNQKVSSRSVALNQPVRLELTTVPRQVETANIEAAIADAVTLGVSATWRLVGRPTVQTDDKTRTVRVTVVLLPRAVGDAVLPALPVSWLNGDQVAEFGSVKVEPQLVIGGEVKPLPAELTTVAGFAWGAKLDEIKAQAGATSADGERIVAKPKPGLDLVFRRGELVEAAIDAGEITLDAARASFLARWGSPQIEEAGQITWVLGWTRITAAPTTDGKGIRLALAREDLLGRAVQARVGEKIFGLLEAK